MMHLAGLASCRAAQLNSDVRRHFSPMRYIVALLSLLMSAHGQAQEAASTQISIRFGDVVQLTFPDHWIYADPDRPQDVVKRHNEIRTSFTLPKPIPASGVLLFNARSAPSGVEPELRLSLTLSSRVDVSRIELEAGLREQAQSATYAMPSNESSLPRVLTGPAFVKDLTVLEARIVRRGALLCESYAVQYRIDSKLNEAQSLVCPLERGSIRLILEGGSPQPGKINPILSAISSSVAE